MKSHAPPILRVCMIIRESALRARLEAALNGSPDVACDGTFSDAESAVAHVRRAQPDLVVLDVTLARPDLAEGVRRLKAQAPNARVVLMVRRPTDPQIAQLLRVEADGILGPDELVPAPFLAALRAAHQGAYPLGRCVREFLRRQAGDAPAPPAPTEELTGREREVAHCMEQGLTDPEIAQRLGISRNTVRTHVKHVLEKTGSHTRTEAVWKLFGRRA